MAGTIANRVDAAARKRHVDNIIFRYNSRKRGHETPNEECAKCGAVSWFPDSSDGWWYCFTCGARAYHDGDRLVQRSV